MFVESVGQTEQVIIPIALLDKDLGQTFREGLSQATDALRAFQQWLLVAPFAQRRGTDWPSWHEATQALNRTRDKWLDTLQHRLNESSTPPDQAAAPSVRTRLRHQFRRDSKRLRG